MAAVLMGGFRLSEAPKSALAVGETAVQLSNTKELGKVLYSQYLYPLEVAAAILLVAMIGAIVLTLRHKVGVKRQNIADQVARTKETAMEVRKVAPGHGLGGE
jgi:NADH-quinone oxidoreductase subunit J